MRGNPDNFLDSVETHIRAAIERCGDRWGRNTGLLADGFSLRDGEPLRWEEAIVLRSELPAESVAGARWSRGRARRG